MRSAATLAIALAGAAMLAPSTSAQAETLKIMTGPQGGSWMPIGGALKNIWEQGIPGLTIQTLPGAGVANVRGIEEKRADIGFGNSIGTVDGIAGSAPFPRAVRNVCNIGSLYPQWFQVVALEDSGIARRSGLRPDRWPAWPDPRGPAGVAAWRGRRSHPAPNRSAHPAERTSVAAASHPPAPAAGSF